MLMEMLPFYLLPFDCLSFVLCLSSSTISLVNAISRSSLNLISSSVSKLFFDDLAYLF